MFVCVWCCGLVSILVLWVLLFWFDLICVLFVGLLFDLCGYGGFVWCFVCFGLDDLHFGLRFGLVVDCLILLLD